MSDKKTDEKPLSSAGFRLMNLSMVALVLLAAYAIWRLVGWMVATATTVAIAVVVVLFLYAAVRSVRRSKSPDTPT